MKHSFFIHADTRPATAGIRHSHERQGPGAGQGRDSNWSVGVVRSDQVEHQVLSVKSGEEVTQTAVAIAERLAELGYRGGPVVLIPPAHACLSALIRVDDLPRSDRHLTMMYRFEEHLPIAAEHIAAAFISDGRGALGIAIEADAWRPIIDTLEDEGVIIEIICPAVALVWSALRASGETHNVDGWIWIENHHVELLLARNGQPIAWHSVAAQSSVLPYLLNDFSSSGPGDVRLSVYCGDSSDLPRAILSLSDQIKPPITPNSRSLIETAALAVPAALSGHIEPPNLRRDRLAPNDRWRSIRRPLSTAVASLALLLILTSVALQWRAYRYSEQTLAYQGRQQVAFERVFPGQRIPAAILSRLQSEKKRLDGVSGSDQQMPPRPSGLRLLREVLRRLPSGDTTRYRILELTIDAERIDIEGEALNHGDADVLAAALRTQRGFDIAPPQSEQLRGEGVRFVIHGDIGRMGVSVDPETLAGGGS